MVWYSSQELVLLHRVHSEAVVPMAATHKVLAVGGQHKQVGIHLYILGKGTIHIYPSGSGQKRKKKCL